MDQSWVESLRDHVGPTLREVKFILHRMKGDLFSLVGIMIIVFFIGIALLAPMIAPPDPGADPYILKRVRYKYSLITPPPSPPSQDHPFGTLAGYDIFYGCIWGTRTVFRICLQVTFIALAVGLLIGCLAGYFGGLLDEFLMRFTDIFLGFPGLILPMMLIMIMRSLGIEELNNVGPVSFVAALGLDRLTLALAAKGWMTYARLIRGEFIKVKNEEYVEAARAIGCSNFRIVVRHILPNSMYPLIAMVSIGIGGVALDTAILSFLQIGIPVGYADWAPFIALSRNWITSSFEYAYTFLIPSAFLITFILGCTLLGDTLRDALDPMIRRT